jgi:hypothetical protein
MKIKDQQINKDDFFAYSETMRGLPVSDEEYPFDAEVNDALDQLERIYEIIGSVGSPTDKRRPKGSSNSSLINNALKIK